MQQYEDLQNGNQDGKNDLEMMQLSNAALHALMTDSVEHLEELTQWYSIINTPIAKYSLAETNFALGNYAEAKNVLNEIPKTFEFGEKELIEHENYMKFYDFKQSLQLSDKTWADLTEGELFELQTIATVTNGRSATMARGVLCFFYGICLEDKEFEENGDNPVYAPSQVGAASNTETLDDTSIVYPNPTNNFIYFENLDGNLVSLHNANGLLLETTKSSSMDLSKYPSGTYFLKINAKMVKIIKN
jgi:hypothetical protein